MYYSLFAFLITLKSIQYLFLCHEEGTDFCKQTSFLLYKTSILMKKWQQWVFINVMYYSTAFLILFSKNVSYFLPFVLYIFLLEWSCRANKAALFFTYSHFNLLFKNSFFHLSHFDSLSLQIIIKKTFSKCLTLLFIIYYNWILCYLIILQWSLDSEAVDKPTQFDFLWFIPCLFDIVLALLVLTKSISYFNLVKPHFL